MSKLTPTFKAGIHGVPKKYALIKCGCGEYSFVGRSKDGKLNCPYCAAIATEIDRKSLKPC